MLQYLAAGAQHVVGRNGVDTVLEAARNDRGRAGPLPEPFGIRFVENSDVRHTGALRDMRGAAIIGHDQARLQHDRTKLRYWPAIGDGKVRPPHRLQRIPFRRLLSAQYVEEPGAVAQQLFEPVSQPNIVRQAPSLERAGATARHHHHVGPRGGAQVRARQRLEALVRRAFKVEGAVRGQQAQIGQADVFGGVLAVAVRPDQVADACVAEPKPDRRQPQQIDQAEAFAAVVQTDANPGLFFQAAQVIAECRRAHELIDPGQRSVEIAHIIPRDHLDPFR
ncbi:hypothetical protein G6F57_017263 [Rhizopus arrhizus]|nr:hypothetical protein G6F57_017263 [Rhizopus arrhizus]